MKTPKTGAVTVRLEPDLKARLTAAATKLDLSENDIVRHAVRAAVNAIEANDYKIELPLKMALKKTPAVAIVERARSGVTGLNEPAGRYGAKKGKNR